MIFGKKADGDKIYSYAQIFPQLWFMMETFLIFGSKKT
jgi:hypothetical protein